MKSIALAIVFIGILAVNSFDNWMLDRREYTEPQGYAALIALFAFIGSLFL
jgi:hypothetical protein